MARGAAEPRRARAIPSDTSVAETIMKRILVACAIAASAALAASGAFAQSHGGRGGGNWSGGHGGNWSGGHGGNWSGGHGGHGSGGHWSGGRGGWYGGGRYYGGHRYYYPRYGGFGSIYFGVPWYWPSYYYPYTYYDYPAYYDAPTQVYVEPPAPATQFYCPDAGYYPAVRTCPRGWLRVVPDAPPPQ
jgi:hypothetical protein